MWLGLQRVLNLMVRRYLSQHYYSKSLFWSMISGSFTCWNNWNSFSPALLPTISTTWSTLSPQQHPQCEPMWTYEPNTSRWVLPPTCHPRLSHLHPKFCLVATAVPTFPFLSICVHMHIFITLSLSPVHVCIHICKITWLNWPCVLSSHLLFWGIAPL